MESPVPFDPPLTDPESLSSLLDTDWQHLVSGCIGVGIIGFSTLVILLPMRGFGFIGYHPNLFRGSSRGDRYSKPSHLASSHTVLRRPIHLRWRQAEKTDRSVPQFGDSCIVHSGRGWNDQGPIPLLQVHIIRGGHCSREIWHHYTAGRRANNLICVSADR